MFESIQERSNLTRSQLLFWAGQKLRPAEPLYNMAVCYSIPMRIDVDRLQAAWRTLVDSSDALRTAIEERDGVPMQTVLPQIDHALEIVDFSGADASRWIRERSETIFDLDRRLYDAALIKIADDSFILYVNHHQIIGDAWASYLIYRRLSEIYAGRAAEFPPFREYIEFERENRGSPRYQKSKAYWKQQLHEPADDMKLYGKAPGATTRGRRLTTELDRERVAALRARSREVFVGTPDLSLFVLFVSI
ncbi:MAG TPA: condensation domain-containing protein, partial [Pyrinomonadaceae bacterium]|nr:condensation domain-containing protein [Pyrinomonadaceae bacterium]